jgi:HEAT repeat protein
MPSFKTDVSFLEKIAIGAVGARRVFQHLRQLGHNPIELERGSMSYKLWKKIKIKRIRVPDILCVDSGTRIESRAKTNLEISMSHSTSDPERGWDHGLDDNDYVAIVECQRAGDKPIEWVPDEIVQYISVRALREKVRQDKVYHIKPKGAQEGFESRITWPAAIASSAGVVKGTNKKNLQFSRAIDHRTITLRLSQRGIIMTPLVRVDDHVTQNQVLASVVPVSQSFPSVPVDERYYTKRLESTALSERYAAAKALSFFNTPGSVHALKQRLNDAREHIYVRLETAASLARFEQNEGYQFIETCLRDPYLQNVLESVIVLAEIKTRESCRLLCSVLVEERRDPEIRAGAAWALGELNNRAGLDALVSSFASLEQPVRVEAARALANLTRDFSADVIDRFRKSSPITRPGIAWALARASEVKIDDLLPSLGDEDSRLWVSYIAGFQGEPRYIGEIEKLKSADPEVYFAVTVLWKILTSWIYNLTEY